MHASLGRVCDNLILPTTAHMRRSMLNTLWLAFFIVASVSGLYQWIALDDPEVFSRIVLGLFDMAELSVQVMILLFGTLTLWLGRSEEHTSELQSLMRISYAVFCLQKKKLQSNNIT